MAESLLHNYPASFSPALDVLIDKLTGTEVAWPELAHAGWHAAGYALSQVDKHGVQGGVGRLLTEGETLEKLKACKVGVHGKEGIQGVTAGDWKTLALTIMQLLIKWQLGL
jgi:hypothetical protein